MGVDKSNVLLMMLGDKGIKSIKPARSLSPKARPKSGKTTNQAGFISKDNKQEHPTNEWKMSPNNKQKSSRNPVRQGDPATSQLFSEPEKELFDNQSL